MSLTNPNKVVTEQRLNEYHNAILPYLGGIAEAGFTPVGTVIAVMGNTAPANYLACNGQVVNIADYPILADYFGAQFGTKNHFGGDGTTTFAVPDLRGEFLRGTGTNSHANQGSGAAVGVHQDATEHNNIWSDASPKINIGYNTTRVNLKYDSSLNDTTEVYTTGVLNYASTSDIRHYTSRPTNTSVLYCIATHNIFMNPELQYSTQEQVVGTWVDGRPVYQKTFTGGKTKSNSNIASNKIYDFTSLSISTVVDFFGCIANSLPLNIDRQDGTYKVSTFCNTDGAFNKVSSDSWNNLDVVLTLRYTKTTD